MSLHPEMRRESLHNLTEDQAAIIGKMEMQTPEIDCGLTKEQWDRVLGKKEELKKEILLIPEDFEITRINTKDIGTFDKTKIDGEKVIVWYPNGPTGRAEIAMTPERWTQVADLIPTMLAVLTGNAPKAIEVSEAFPEPDGEEDNDEI